MSVAPELTQFALRRRLLVLILFPLALIGAVNAWTDLKLAGSAASLQDEQLTRLMPLFANAILSARQEPSFSDSVVMLVPDLQQFLAERGSQAGFRLSRLDGALLAGNANIDAIVPSAADVELHSEQRGGTTWRVAALRVQLAEGQEVVLQVADGSNAQHRWLQAMARRVLLPNVLMALVVYVAVTWGVKRALAPLVDLQRAVERRDASDLSAIDERGVPQEVSPLVAALNRLFANAKQQSEVQRRFVADAAHQLRTPLAALRTEVQAVVAQAADTESSVVLPKATVERIDRATQRAAALTHQLLSLSRAENEAVHPVLEPESVIDLMEDVLHRHWNAAEALDADLGVDIDPLLRGARVLGQPLLLRELLSNLVDNALKYAGHGAIVTLGARKLETGRVEVSVADNGPGVSADEQRLVLQRFYRAKGTPGEGNGLGLAIAAEIAQRHGSELTVRAADANPDRPGLWVGFSLSLGP